MRFPIWNVAFWSTIALLILAVELLGVFDGRFLTITYIIRTYVPKWVIAGVLGVLAHHFLK